MTWWKKVLRDRPDLARPTDAHIRAIFDKRAIREEVWKARPYVPYAAGDWKAVAEAEPRFEQLLEPGQINYLRRLVNQRPGLVMHRESWDSRHLLAQLRPFKFKELDFDVRAAYGAEDQGVWSKRWSHNHDDPHEHQDGRAYIIRSKGSPRGSRKGKRRRDDAYMPTHIAQAHGGNPPPDGVPHPHYPVAHVRGPYHRGRHRRGEHGHDEFAKYVYAPGQPTNLIDVHPLAWGLLETPPGEHPALTADPYLDWAPVASNVAYLALEGVLKNDAILSQGVPVANVGSVTLWDDESRDDGTRGPQAFSWFVREYLAAFGRTVVVVPDSDALGNQLVMSQTRQIVERLNIDQGVRAIIAFPTAYCGDICRHLTRDTGRTTPEGDPILLPDEDHKRGVDDFLGDGKALEDMIVDEIKEEQMEPEVLRRRRDQFKRDTAILEHLRRVCADDGFAVVTQRQIAATTGWSQPSVREALQSLERQKLLSFEDPAPFFEGQDHRRPPTVVRLRQDLPLRRESVRLGDVLETYQ